MGSAGYIGSHTAMALQNAGYDVLVFDNLSTGHASFLRFGRHVLGDLSDRVSLEKLFAENNISAVMHFAAFAHVGESVSDPTKYYHNNVPIPSIFWKPSVNMRRVPLSFLPLAPFTAYRSRCRYGRITRKLPAVPMGGRSWPLSGCFRISLKLTP